MIHVSFGNVGYFMQGSPASHRTVGKAILKKADDLVGDLAAACEQTDQNGPKLFLLRVGPFEKHSAGESTGTTHGTWLAACAIAQAGVPSVPLNVRGNWIGPLVAGPLLSTSGPLNLSERSLRCVEPHLAPSSKVSLSGIVQMCDLFRLGRPAQMRGRCSLTACGFCT